jgi:iron(III) transport system ATP-binding protein
MTHLLEVENISCSYGRERVVEDLSFAVTEGFIACLLGPSGCGKTTVLRAIAGFHPVDRGLIKIDGRTVSSPGYELAPERRQVGMVFQDHALFPHLRVAENVRFGLRGVSGAVEIADRMLDRVGLAGMGKRYPHELSGGQQQRVALARALAPTPKLLLMDEPFSNLDLDTREKLSYEVRDILKDYGTTGILVTHDQHDAFALCDRVGVMTGGGLVQWDTPYNLYHEPASRFVADFIGDGVFLPGTLLSPDTVETKLGVVRGNRAYGWPAGSAIDVLLRPDDVIPGEEGDLQAVVARKAFKGAEILYTLELEDGTRVLSLFPSHANHTLGEHVNIQLKADHLVAFRRDDANPFHPD